MNKDLHTLCKYIDTHLHLSNASLGEEYFYQSISLCVIDSVFSIGVRYQGVRNTVKRYCEHFKLQQFRNPRHQLPAIESQESVSDLCKNIEAYSFQEMADNIFQNRQRTSSRNGILKAQAVYDFAQNLSKFGIQYLQDFSSLSMTDFAEVSRLIKLIPGQKSGISLQYFSMLAGSEHLIKPDRMILRFIETALNRQTSITEASDLLISATSELNLKYPQLTPRLLDHEIWKYQRANPPKNCV